MHPRTCTWLLLLCLLALPVGAAVKRIDPADPVELKSHEGLLLLAVDSTIPLYSTTVNRPGKVLSPAVLRKLEVGATHALFVVDAGRYSWQELKPFFNWRFRIRADAGLEFEVQPGVLNYPGDLVVDSRSGWIADVGLYNRSLRAIDWLRTAHPAVLETWPLAFRGHYPDPFPAFYRQLSGGTADMPAAAPPVLPDIEFSPDQLSPELLWRERTLLGLTLSPDGRFLALHLHPEEKQWQIDLIDLADSQRRVLAKSVAPYRRMAWSGQNRLVLESGPPGAAVVELIAMQPGEGQVEYDHVRLVRRGSLVDALPNQPDHILLASTSRLDQLMVHRVDISNQARASAFNSGYADRLNKGVDKDRGWLADGKGRLRLALVQLDEELVWMHGLDGDFRRVPDFEDPDFEPLSLTPGGDRVIGLSDHQRSQRDLVEVDIASGRIVATLHSRAGIDLTNAIFSSDGRAIGAVHYRQGQLVSEYFDRRQAAWAERLQKAFAGASVELAASSEDGGTQLIWVDASDRPPQLYHFDRASRTAALVLDAMPQLQDRPFVTTRQIDVQAVETVLDAFLTLPASDRPRPLVVFPHGGPIGVADSLHFDPAVQFLASLGHAVLQVNFRGSDGYGRAFREAAERNYGKLIEDDIDAAIQHVLKQHPIDPDRICILGSSYGGYSALIASLRWPERFRCAASIAGVTDRLLRFTASDNAQSAEGRADLEKLMGDPNSESAALQEDSPLYRYKELATPVLLAHGLDDRRVDAEHSRRLERMLTHAGRPPVTLYFEGEGHGLQKISNEHRLWNSIAAFLQQHLGATTDARAN